MKVQLIQPPPKYVHLFRHGCFQPLGILSIGTYIKSKSPELDVEVLDGDVISLEEIISKINADYVGISIPSFSHYNSALKIAEYAKNKNSTVVFGGPFASSIDKRILDNRDFVDFVARGDGEETFYKLIKKEKLENINNLTYRKNNKIIQNSRHNLNLDSLPIINRKFVDMNIYFKNFQSKIESELTDFKKSSNVYTQKGCLYAVSQKSRCFFCARLDMGWRGRNPKLVWQEITDLVNNYGVDYIHEVSDSITTNRKWFEKFVNEKPKYINPNFLVYSNVNEIDKNITELLKKLNVYEIILGLESGNQKCLDLANKGFTVENSKNALKLLKKYGIKAHVSIVPGLPGETKESLNETYKFMKDICNIGLIEAISATLLVPLPSAKAYETLMENSKIAREKYFETDILDIKDLKKKWFDYLKLNMNYVEGIAQKIRELAPIKGGWMENPNLFK